MVLLRQMSDRSDFGLAKVREGIDIDIEVYLRGLILLRSCMTYTYIQVLDRNRGLERMDHPICDTQGYTKRR